MSVEKERLFVTLNKPYLEVLNWLVSAGFFRDRQTAIRAGVRLLSKEFKIPPFYPEEEAEGQ